MIPSKLFRTLAALFLLLAGTAFAQELEPRAYQPAPTGVNGLTLGYTNSAGDIVFDPATPVKDAQANLHLETAAFYRTFGLLGRFSNVAVSVNYAAGHLNGSVNNVEQRIYRSGLGDMRVRFSLNLKGTPALSVQEFMKHEPRLNLVYGLAVSMPTGQYDPSKLISIGQNRWAIKQELAMIEPVGKWQIDLYGGFWLFTDNGDYMGRNLSQSLLSSYQFHLSRNFHRNCWFGLDSNFYRGGRTTVDGVEGTTEQSNSRIGGTLAIPIRTGHLLKFSVSRGVFVSRGGNFTNIGASYTYGWLKK